MERLVLEESEVAALLNSPDIRAGDSKAFQNFSLYVDLLVGMLESLEQWWTLTKYFYLSSLTFLLYLSKFFK